MKRFRLQITDPFEDRPRLLTAYGRVPGGEVGLVLRPLDHSVLVVQLTKDAATVWRNEPGSRVKAAWPRFDAVAERGPVHAWGRFVDVAGVSRRLHLDGAVAEDEVVTVAADLEAGRLYRVDGDAPREPTEAMDPAGAVKQIREAQRAAGKRGPATFRGQWSGVLIWGDGPPRVELKRKLASYGWLQIRSEAGGWRWMFDRQGQWFTSTSSTAGGPVGTLVQAIDAGVAAGLGLVREACGVRDTTRKSERPEPAAPEPRGPRNREVRTTAAVKAKRTAKRSTLRPRMDPPVADKALVPSCACDVETDPPQVPRTSSAKRQRSRAPAVEAQDKALMQAFARALDNALVA